jgi:hypothetical protein
MAPPPMNPEASVSPVAEDDPLTVVPFGRPAVDLSHPAHLVPGSEPLSPQPHAGGSPVPG